MRKLREECGVFGLRASARGDVAGLTFAGLLALQHRGQESCGIVVNDDGVFSGYKDLGLVREVFPPPVLDVLGQGEMAVGHVRYGTTGGNDRRNAQPLVVNHVKAPWPWLTMGISSTPMRFAGNWSSREPFSTPPATQR